MNQMSVEEMHDFLMAQPSVTKITTTQQKGEKAILFIAYKYSSTRLKGDSIKDCFDVAMKPYLDRIKGERE